MWIGAEHGKDKDEEHGWSIKELDPECSSSTIVMGLWASLSMSRAGGQLDWLVTMGKCKDRNIIGIGQGTAAQNLGKLNRVWAPLDQHVHVAAAHKFSKHYKDMVRGNQEKGK